LANGHFADMLTAAAQDQLAAKADI